ncbi:TIM barrel protein [Desulfuromonas carbonis]|uniref:sugar phosphate isomerase/epimerase family protein n=1 Tax=Desulfuromonas sp. DDH964 TaxID=1823759 RepID=UPI00078CDF43|nr:sugar phosphate isomerase/epimerase [Desulfuromonas sp. DDH964]AMV73720.1 hypothetical protein DBW_3422 [Desulfuromonas sp. DDH964]
MLKIGSQINEVRVDGDLDALRRDLEAFADFGLEAVEIPVHGLDAIRNGKLHRPTLLAARQLVEAFPFAYSVHAPNPLNLMTRERFDLHVAVFRATLEFATEIGAQAVVYHPGRYLSEEAFAVSPGSPQVAEDEKRRLLEREAATLQNLAAEFPELCIAMENARPYRGHSPYCYAEKPVELKAQVRRIARENVRVALDTGHLQMAARFYDLDPAAEAGHLSGLIAHCHVHDNFGDPVYASEKLQTHQLPFGRGDSHMPVGWGGIDFAGILASLLPDYAGLLITELRSRYFRHTRESVQNLAAIVARLRQETEEHRLTARR